MKNIISLLILLILSITYKAFAYNDEVRNILNELDNVIENKKEYYKSVENTIDKSLSKFEKQVLNRYIQGESYVQIAEKLDTPVKSIDNAIQRIRKKATKDLQENDN